MTNRPDDSKHAFLSLPVIQLYIQEEYGYRHWLAVLPNAEYRDLIRRWETMRGLTCLVPVQLIIPQAQPLEWQPARGTFDAQCHIHESGDSFLDGSSYQIPESEDGLFWIDGQSSSTDESFEYPDVLLSREHPAADIERVLASAWPGFTVVHDMSETERLLKATGVALLRRREDPAWACSLSFRWLPPALDLSTLPNLAIAKRLSDALGVSALTDASGLFSRPESLSGVGQVILRADGAWFLADPVPSSDGTALEVQIVRRIEDLHD